jgi:uncharacterized protein (TIRG00374 family)
VKARARTWALALLAGVAAFAAWWKLYDGPRVASTALGADPRLVLGGLALLAGAQVLRLLRWHALLNALGRVALSRTFALLYASELVNTLLPVKVGDLGRAIALARRNPGFTLGSAGATMVLDRLWGVGARLLVLPVLLALPSTLPTSLRLSVGIFASALLLALAGAAAWGARPEPVARALAPLLRLVPVPVRDAAARTLRSFADSSVRVGLAPRLALIVAALSLGSVLAQAGAFALFFRAAGHAVPFGVAAAGTALLDLLAVVPAPPAGVGTTEWYATLIFASGLGQPVGPSATAALLYHAAWLLVVFLAGAAALPAVGEMLPRAAPEARE